MVVFEGPGVRGLCAILAANDVTLRNAGKKCRGSTGFLRGHWLEQHFQSDNGNVRRQQKTGCQDASEFMENTMRYHASQTAGQWVRGKLRNMQVAGQMNNDENRPKLITNETEVVDQVALCCRAALLLWVTTTMARSGKTIEQMQETL